MSTCKCAAWCRSIRVGTKPLPALAGEAGGDLGKGPVGLGDAGARLLDAAARTPPVPVDGPEREPGDVIRVRPVADVGPDRRRGDLGLVGHAIHAGDSNMVVGLRVAPAEGRP